MPNIFKTFKPITPGLRETKLLSRSNLLKNIKPLKSLTKGFTRICGRNNQGIKTNWNKGSGHKRLYREINSFTNKIKDDFGIVEGLEYDPNRNSTLIRVFNPDKHQHFYSLGIKDLEYKSIIKENISSFSLGCRIYLKDVLIGQIINNLSSGYNKPGKYLRSAGAYGQIIFKNTKLARVKLISGEHRIFPVISKVTLGCVGNENRKFISLGKAGRNRWLGKRPTVRGVAINPVDHPHGGGEGKTSGGKPGVTPWGKPTKNQPTLKTQNKIRVQLNFRSSKNVKK
jgi:large subunit ribosomal protein L2